MKKLYLRTGLLVVVGLLLVFAQAGPSEAGGGIKLIAISRVCASDGLPTPGPNCAGEIFTTLAPSGTPPASGGMIIYDRTLHMEDADVVIVHLTASSDGHFGARTMLSCMFDNVACDPAAANVPLAPDGWTTVQRHRDYSLDYVALGLGFGGDGGGGAGDLHDNAVSVTWCAKMPDLDHPDVDLRNVKIRLASGPNDIPGGGLANAFLDSVRVSVSTAKMGKQNQDRCNVVLSPGTPG